MANEQKGEKNIIDVMGYTGKRVIFTEKKWRIKSVQHPELHNRKFLSNVTKTIESPLIVWQDFDDPQKKICCYWKYSIDNYIKVVIWIFGNPWQVVTAFQTNFIKEEKYPNLKQLV